MAGGSQDKATDWGEQKASPRFAIGTVAIGLLAAWLVWIMFSGQGADSVEAPTPQTARPTAQANRGDCTPDFSQAAQTYIQAWGYSCGEVSQCNLFSFSRGATVNCSLMYTYYLKDKGGNWVVEYVGSSRHY